MDTSADTLTFILLPPQQPSSSIELKDSLSLSKSVKIYKWSTTHTIWAAI